MRVGWVVDGNLDQVSGGYLYDHIVVDHLRHKGVEVETVSLPTGRYAARLVGGLASGLDPRLADGFDVLIEDELSHPALIGPNRRLARSHPHMRRVGLVHHLRSSERRNRLANAMFRWIERAYLRSVAAFIFNSRTTRDTVWRVLTKESRGDAGSWPSVIAVPGADRLPVAIDDERIAARAGEAGPLRVLFVGSIIPRKGLPTLIEAFSLLPPHAAVLTVAGDMLVDPGHTRRLRRLVRRFRLDERITFRGALDRRQLSQEMAVHHVTAMPSSYEGYGMAHLEGMGFGLPAIAGSAGGAVEFVRDGENGLLVDPADPAALASRLLSLHEDRPRLARLAQAARRTYLAHPTWADTGEVIFRFLRTLVEADAPQA